MKSYRVTKYNPEFRDASGRHASDDWTSISDVGGLVQGRRLSMERYRLVEDAYVAAIARFMDAADLHALTLTDLEYHGDGEGLPEPAQSESAEWVRTLPLVGQVISLTEIEKIARLALREVIWCKMRGAGFFVHFGRDYYMYIGLAAPPPPVAPPLFVEVYESPYA